MMRKWMAGGLILLLMLAAAGCAGKQADSSSGMDMNMDMDTANMADHIVQVDLSWSPQDPKVGDKVTFTAKVTQDDAAVNDANEVEFEIGATDGANVQTHKAEAAGDGVYSFAQTFDKAGSYYVISHVTAREMHVMPKKQFEVSE